jgi:hypothetical protein
MPLYCIYIKPSFRLRLCVLSHLFASCSHRNNVSNSVLPMHDTALPISSLTSSFQLNWARGTCTEASHHFQDVIFWDMKPCHSSKKSQRSGGTYRLHLQSNETMNLPSSQRGCAALRKAKRASWGTSTFVFVRYRGVTVDGPLLHHFKSETSNYPFPFGPNIPLSISLSDTLSLCSFLMRQVSHPYRTICKIVFLY